MMFHSSIKETKYHDYFFKLLVITISHFVKAVVSSWHYINNLTLFTFTPVHLALLQAK